MQTYIVFSTQHIKLQLLLIEQENFERWQQDIMLQKGKQVGIWTVL